MILSNHVIIVHDLTDDINFTTIRYAAPLIFIAGFIVLHICDLGRV